MKCAQRPALAALAAATVLLLAACSGEVDPASKPAAGSETLVEGLAELVPNGSEPWPGIVTGGQPTAEDLAALRDAGLRTVINLRVPTERGTQDEPKWIEELDLAYVSIPVQGKEGLTEEVARQLDLALETSERPVLVHCGSGNRVGAVFALRAFYLEGKAPEAALAIGRTAGVTRLEAAVEKLLAEAAGE